MTVCIAATATERLLSGKIPLIVTASDQMVGTGFSSADEAMVKLEPFHKDWSAMIAANDLSQYVPIIERARANFRGKPNTLLMARTAFKRAYQQHVSEKAVDEVLGRFGLDMDTFRKTGLRQFGESEFRALCDDIKQVSAECKFLVFGYDKDHTPHIFTVENPGIDEVQDKPGYCAIGAGQYAAEPVLTLFNQNEECTLRQSIINVCCAKFMAERVPGVGKSTHLFVKRQGYPMYGYVGMDIVKEIRKAWELDGCPRVPTGILERLQAVNISFLTGEPNWDEESL